MESSAVPSTEAIGKATGLPVFEVTGALEWMEGPVSFAENDIGTLAKFASSVGAEVVFVQYDYADIDEYFIDPDDWDLDDLEDLNSVLDAIDDRNDELEGLFEKGYAETPMGCSVFVMYQGTAYGMFVTDDALIEDLGETAEEFITSLLEEE